MIDIKIIQFPSDEYKMCIKLKLYHTNFNHYINSFFPLYIYLHREKEMGGPQKWQSFMITAVKIEKTSSGTNTWLFEDTTMDF